MDANLSRRLALISQSPLYMGRIDREKNQEVIDVCVSAYTWDKLPERMKLFLEQCEKSTTISDRKGYRYPYTGEQINDVIDSLEDPVPVGNDNAN